MNMIYIEFLMGKYDIYWALIVNMMYIEFSVGEYDIYIEL